MSKIYVYTPLKLEDLKFSKRFVRPYQKRAEVYEHEDLICKMWIYKSGYKEPEGWLLSCSHRHPFNRNETYQVKNKLYSSPEECLAKAEEFRQYLLEQVLTVIELGRTSI
jgi:hypothetical protein